MTEDSTTDPKDFHHARYANYDAMLGGLCVAIWDEIHSTEEDKTDDEDASAHLSLIWAETLEDGGFQVRAATIPYSDDDEVIERADPDFYITTYDDEDPRTIREDLEAVMDDHFGDEDGTGDDDDAQQ